MILSLDSSEKRYTVRYNDFILPFFFRKLKSHIESYYGRDL